MLCRCNFWACRPSCHRSCRCGLGSLHSSLPHSQATGSCLQHRSPVQEQKALLCGRGGVLCYERFVKFLSSCTLATLVHGGAQQGIACWADVIPQGVCLWGGKNATPKAMSGWGIVPVAWRTVFPTLTFGGLYLMLSRRSSPSRLAVPLVSAVIHTPSTCTRTSFCCRGGATMCSLGPGGGGGWGGLGSHGSSPDSTLECVCRLGQG